MRVKHRSGKGAIPLPALAAFVIAGIACSGKNGDGSEPGPVQVNIITGEGTFEGYWPASLLVTFHNTAFPTIYHLEIEGGRLYQDAAVQAVNDGWRFSAQLSEQQAVAGSGQIPIVSGVSALESQGSVQRTGPTTITADQGTCDFALAKGKISGTCNVTPSSMSASFSGDLAVECWVPESWLGQSPDGETTPDGGSETGVLDAHFDTAPCKPFLAWKP
ncbi:MAG: hypothetical protein WCG85_10320 [Polyangia bacterium]